MSHPLLKPGTSEIANRPLGLALIALFWLFIGGSLVFSGAMLVFDSMLTDAKQFSFEFGTFLFLIGAFCCSSASGLWLFTNWGRGMIMGLSYVAIPLGLVSMFPPLAGESSSLENTLTQLVSMGINAWMIFYLHGDYARDRFPADEKKGD